MDFQLSEELQMLKDMVRDFVDEKIAPFADEWEEKHYFPYKEAIKPMADLGFFGTVIPEEYGGIIWAGWPPLFSPRKLPVARARLGFRLTCRQQGMRSLSIIMEAMK